jgi:hypothetical protein
MNKKSLKDNPLAENDVVINSVTGRRFSKEAIEENKANNEGIKEIIEEDIKEQKQLSENESKKINEYIKEYEKEQEKGKDNSYNEEEIEKLLKANEELKANLKEAEKKLDKKEKDTKENKDKTIYIKKTYIIKQETINIIEGLALLTNQDRKVIVNKMLEDGINAVIERANPSIIEKALKEYEKDKKAKEKAKSEENIF